MSQKNVEVVQRIWRHWTEGVENDDPGALQAPFDEGLLAPDSTVTPLGYRVSAGSRTWGIDGLREFVRDWIQAWTDWSVALDDVVAMV